MALLICPWTACITYEAWFSVGKKISLLRRIQALRQPDLCLLSTASVLPVTKESLEMSENICCHLFASAWVCGSASKGAWKTWFW